MYMHVYVCICMYMYVHVCICMYMYMYACLYMYIFIFLYVSIYIVISIYIYIYTYKCKYTYMYMYVYIYVYIYMYICIYVYMVYLLSSGAFRSGQESESRPGTSCIMHTCIYYTRLCDKAPNVSIQTAHLSQSLIWWGQKRYSVCRFFRVISRDRPESSDATSYTLHTCFTALRVRMQPLSQC